jgi:hypothetical protein
VVFVNISTTHIPSKNETDLAVNLTRTVIATSLWSLFVPQRESNRYYSLYDEDFASCIMSKVGKDYHCIIIAICIYLIVRVNSQSSRSLN